MRLRSFITRHLWGLIGGLTLLISSTVLIISNFSNFFSLAPHLGGFNYLDCLGAIWLGVLLLASFLTSQQTANVRLGVVTALIASWIGGAGSWIAILMYAFLVAPVILPPTLILSVRDVAPGLMVILLIPVTIVVIAGPIIGLIGGYIGWAVATARDSCWTL
jgi:hypothetical protein